jgi:hypothetical protein
MTGDESRKLCIGIRVCWAKNPKDQGTITEVDWSGVTIRWDDGQNISVRHNDMVDVSVAGRAQTGQ